MASESPIAKRLDWLNDQWVEFAENANARLLRWLFEPDEARVVEAFLSKEADEDTGELPDLFVPLRTSFTNPRGHGFLLAEALSAECEAAGEEGQGWQRPSLKANESDVAFFVRTCASFIDHHELPAALVLVLQPEKVDDADAYQTWLQRAIQATPENLRFIVLDDADTPALGALADAEPKRVVSQAADLDMPHALEETSAGAGLDTPGGLFRNHFVQMSNALGDGKLGKARQIAPLALAIAQEQKWFHLAVPVHFALGGALVSEGKLEDAVASYTAAEEAAVRGENEGEEAYRETCPGLRVKARLGRAGALVTGRAYGMAADLYEETAPMAESQGDKQAVLDCWRLAAFCHEQNGAIDKAWNAGIEGLKHARELDAEQLQQSSFPHLGETLMRLTRHGAYQQHALRIEQEIVTIAGTLQWRPDEQAAPPVPGAQA